MYLKGKEYFDILSPDKEEVSEYPDGQDQMVIVERQGTVCEHHSCIRASIHDMGQQNVHQTGCKF